MSNVLLSIVIITRNEERNIKRCLDSILYLNIDVSYEVILVDSSSSDRTREIASGYPIKIYNLGELIHHSAAVGRYVGYKMSSGEYILFIDGDMAINNKTDLKEVISLFDIIDSLGCLSGSLEEFVYDEYGQVKRHEQDIYNVNKTEERGDIGGIHIIRKDVMEQIGGVNVTLDNNEELDLIYKLQFNNYKFYRTPKLMIEHHTKEVLSYAIINDRYKFGRYRDMWSVAKISFKYRKFLKHCITNNFVMTWTLLMFFTLINIGSVFYGIFNSLVLICNIILILILFIYKILKKKSLNVVLMDFYYATLAAMSIFQRNQNPKEVQIENVIKDK